MSDLPKTPRVGIKTMSAGGQLSFGLGYLVIRDGHYWCFQNEEDIDKDPHDVGALLLDPSRLAEDPTPDSGVRIYQYQVLFQLPWKPS
jgi:hypothetical protein